MLDRKVDDTFFAGLDELYQRAKFGEDRTTRAGCMCENVVFVFCLFFTGRMPLSGKLPVLNFLTGQKSGFSPRRGDSLHRFKSNFARPTAPGSAWPCKILHQSAQGGRNAAPTYQKFPLFDKESPRRGDSVDRFLKILRYFIRLSIRHLRFKFHVIRITGYGVIAEKPRVGKLGQIFPCTM